MGKAFILSGYFLLGVNIVGLFSYTAYAFPAFANYAFWLLITVSLILIVSALADDYLAEVMGISYQTYVGGLIAIVALILIGSLLQWVR